MIEDCVRLGYDAASVGDQFPKQHRAFKKFGVSRNSKSREAITSWRGVVSENNGVHSSSPGVRLDVIAALCSCPQPLVCT